MSLNSDEYIKQIEAHVSEIEKGSQAEIVVVFSDRSGPYADVDLRWALLLALLSITFILFCNFDIHHYIVLPIVVFFTFIGWFSSHHLPIMRRLFTSAQRRRLQVSSAAMRAFVTESVSATLQRTGVLLYYSQFEGEMVILPDLGVDGKVPRSVWNSVTQKVLLAKGSDNKEKAFLEGMQSLAPVLAKHVPADADRNPDEISNTPRFHHNS